MSGGRGLREVRRAGLGLAVGVVVGCAWAGCGGSTSSLPDAADGSTSSSSSGGGGTVDAGACVTIPASDLPAGNSPASGTVTGPGLDAILCPAGASARVETAGGSTDTSPFLFELTYTVGSNSSADDFLFASPAGATDGELNILVGLPSPDPGQWASTASDTCGGGAFTYYLPVPAGLDCDAGAAPNCPAGCASECSGFGCDPCTPQPPSVSFTASAPGDCLGDTQPAVGSWSLTLTSLDEQKGGGSQKIYAPHGSFTATLSGAGGAAGPITLTASF